MIPSGADTPRHRGIALDLTTFINAYRGPLIGLIASWGAPWSDAAEIAQDSFSVAWLNRGACRGDLRDPEVFGRWLRGVALNQYRNWARSRRRSRVAPLTSLNLDRAFLDRTIETQEPAAAKDLESLRMAIQQLPVNQRQVVLMHYLEETSVEQVAALLAVSVKTVEGRLYQARIALRRMLDGGVTSPHIVRILLCL